MIAPLRIAVGIEPRAELEAALDAAVGKYGFRMTKLRVDNSSARPRICAEFLEKLFSVDTGCAPFVRLQDPKMVVEADSQALCIDGVAFGTH